jgi:hypothetical protein
MAWSKRVLMVAVALMVTWAGSGESAYAWGKHTPKPPKVQRRAKKNTGPYAYLAPKKQKKPKNAEGWYQSPVSGQMVYGTKKK